MFLLPNTIHKPSILVNWFVIASVWVATRFSMPMAFQRNEIPNVVIAKFYRVVCRPLYRLYCTKIVDVTRWWDLTANLLYYNYAVSLANLFSAGRTHIVFGMRTNNLISFVVVYFVVKLHNEININKWCNYTIRDPRQIHRIGPFGLDKRYFFYEIERNSLVSKLTVPWARGEGPGRDPRGSGPIAFCQTCYPSYAPDK